MKKWIALALVLLLALGAYVAAGPYIAMNGIQQALAEQDPNGLERHVDFPAVRASVKAQLEDAMARRMGNDAQSSLLGAFAMGVGRDLMGAGVDAMVTPAGIGALLQGRRMWKQSRGETIDGDTFGPPVPADPLADAVHRYESPSRFTATVLDEGGDPVTFIFERYGLSWKLAGIRLPI